MKNVLFSFMVVAAWLIAGCGGTEFTEGFPPGDQDAGQEAAWDALGDRSDAPSDTDAEADSGEDARPDVPADVQREADAPDVAVDAPEEVGEDAKPDVPADVQPDVLPDVSPEAQPDVVEPDGPQPLDCELHGVPGKIRIIMRHSVSVTKVLAVAGRLTYDDVAQDSNFLTWCWGEPNETELVCVPRDKNNQPAQSIVGVGMRVQFVPGQILDGVQMTNTDMFCTATGCLPEGDYLVCNGKETLCRWNQGVPAGPTDLVIGPWGVQNLVCKLP